VENLFSVIRGSGGHRDNPDVSEFRASFRLIAVNKLLVPVSGSNCEMDCDSVLLDVASLSETLNVTKEQNVNTDITCELVCEDGIDVDTAHVMNSEQENVIAYMSGYLLRRFGFSAVDHDLLFT